MQCFCDIFAKFYMFFCDLGWSVLWLSEATAAVGKPPTHMHGMVYVGAVRKRPPHMRGMFYVGAVRKPPTHNHIPIVGGYGFFL